ncbi:MAG: hypothetical protein ACK5HY_11065 [Parahaliea sp.]
MRTTRDILLHGHIFKNAGTSFDWALQRCFGTGFGENADEQGLREQGTGALAEILTTRGTLRAFSTHHLPAPLPALEHCRLYPLYLLRHPLRRCLSVYAFERRQQADTRGARAAKEYELQDYLAWRLRADVPNVLRSYQTAYLAGDHRPLIDAADMARHFAAAQQLLADQPLVGLVERFDESMVLFEHLLRPLFPDIDLACRPQNQSVDGAGKAGALGSLEAVHERMGPRAAALVDANSYDHPRYPLALGKFEAATRQIPGFPVKLSEYRNRCSLLL